MLKLLGMGQRTLLPFVALLAPVFSWLWDLVKTGNSGVGLLDFIKLHSFHLDQTKVYGNLAFFSQSGQSQLPASSQDSHNGDGHHFLLYHLVNGLQMSLSRTGPLMKRAVWFASVGFASVMFTTGGRGADYLGCPCTPNFPTSSYGATSICYLLKVGMFHHLSKFYQ